VPPGRPRVRTVEFAGAIGRPGQPLPMPLSQIAITGRSNVGKSTLLNRLVGRKSIARTSKRPGRTQEINFFCVDDRFLLADLPGYGFAQAPRDVRHKWGPLVESYLRDSSGLLGIVVLIDSRRGVTADDHRMLDFLAARETPALIALTKTDKLNRSGRREAIRKVREQIGIDEDQLVATSARTGEGLDTLWESMQGLLAGI